jgi:hypothetical protein
VVFTSRSARGGGKPTGRLRAPRAGAGHLRRAVRLRGRPARTSSRTGWVGGRCGCAAQGACADLPSGDDVDAEIHLAGRPRLGPRLRTPRPSARSPT